MGHDINGFELILDFIKPSSVAREDKDVQYERNILVSKEDLLLKDKIKYRIEKGLYHHSIIIKNKKMLSTENPNPNATDFLRLPT